MINIRTCIRSKLSASIAKMIPGVKTNWVITSEYHRDWHYSSPTAIQIFNQNKKVNIFNLKMQNSKVLPSTASSWYKLASIISEEFRNNDEEMMNKIDLHQLGRGNPEYSPFFINFSLRNKYIEKRLKNLLINGPSYTTKCQK